ncbi:MAG TPA: superoxide dismutase family protein [Polyangiaceae bacterium]|nr:superoxide dismutase family protein [Polyangiaceae bacterium]
MQKLSSQRGAKVTILGVSTLLALLACGGSQPEALAPAAETPAATGPAAAELAAPLADAITTPESATAGGTALLAIFQPKSGSKLSGTATLTETPEGVRVVLAVEGISPGEHGVHVHEKGDCSAPDGASAGEHFNPATHPHALPSTSPRHLGDLGNITVGADGKGALEIVATDANLKPADPNSFAGRAIIIHEKKDDGGQPTGNAGGRIGCAEIK